MRESRTIIVNLPGAPDPMTYTVVYLIFLILAITAATLEAAMDDDFIIYSSLSSLNKFIICLVVSLSLTPSSSNTYPKYSEIHKPKKFKIYIKMHTKLMWDKESMCILFTTFSLNNFILLISSKSYTKIISLTYWYFNNFKCNSRNNFHLNTNKYEI